jgi:hypothetical protein
MGGSIESAPTADHESPIRACIRPRVYVCTYADRWQMPWCLIGGVAYDFLSSLAACYPCPGVGLDRTDLLSCATLALGVWVRLIRHAISDGELLSLIN